MPSAWSLFVSIVAGAIGLGYFLYGKRQERLAFLVAGVALCIAPYLIDSTPIEVVVSLALLAAPFLFKS